MTKRSYPTADPNNGPGTYNVTDQFGDNLNDMTIGIKRPTQI